MESEPIQRHPEAKGLIILGITVTLLICLLTFNYGDHSRNWLGLIGYVIAFGCQYLFGLGSYLILGYTGSIGWNLLTATERPKLKMRSLYFSLITLSCCILLNLYAEVSSIESDLIKTHVYSDSIVLKHPYPHRYIRYYVGGAPLYYLYQDLPTFNLQNLLSNIGILLTFSMIGGVSFIFMTGLRMVTIGRQAFLLFKNFISLMHRFYNSLKPLSIDTQSETFNYHTIERSLGTQVKPVFIPPPMEITPSLIKKKSTPPIAIALAKPPPLIGQIEKKIASPPKTKNYTTPPLSLLTPAKKIDQPTLKKDLQRLSDLLEETLLSFGVDGKVGKINCGPTITSFEVHPPTGVKVQKIKILENDIALNLKASSIRIIAPIPGKAAVGVEIPSPQPQEVGFKEMLQSYQKKQHLKIPVLLGKTVTGDDVWCDLTKMPHCLIAGATGSGKSVCINSIVLSILMNTRPDEVRLLLVDPKKVELSAYTRLPHMIAPVITEAQGAYAALNYLVKEMLNRYEILKQMGLRNIQAFNSRKIKPKVEEALNIPIPETMCYIVAIIDEFADLMMASSSDLETPIARIAQMARAVGIHLILATQRPSREVITGLIKANFPTRIAFKVASRINSQIILDDNGAESLLGNGDLLFLPPGSSELIRAQGVYVRDEDINRVIDYIESQAPPQYLIKSFDQLAEEMNADEEPKDDLYLQAKGIVLQTGSASTTYLQRKLKIGYARAASLIDELEMRGVVGPQEGSRPRQVLIKEGLDL
ncbi:MAG: DNA translocase FtsK 4TM domain-containing protein [Simkaniaceae bacterium]|nr:DNA translocase FtsK 4TM domain-containing protein [Simkaniaceae bacterium]